MAAALCGGFVPWHVVAFHDDLDAILRIGNNAYLEHVGDAVQEELPCQPMVNDIILLQVAQQNGLDVCDVFLFVSVDHALEDRRRVMALQLRVRNRAGSLGYFW